MYIFLIAFLFLVFIYAISRPRKDASAARCRSAFPVLFSEPGERIADGVFAEVCDYYYSGWSKAELTTVYIMFDSRVGEVFIFPYSMDKYFGSRLHEIEKYNPVRNEKSAGAAAAAVRDGVVFWLRNGVLLLIFEGNLLKNPEVNVILGEWREIGLELMRGSADSGQASASH